MIFLQVDDLLLQLLIHGALPQLRQTVSAVHHGLGQLSAQAGLGGGAAHAGDKLTAGLGKGGDAALDQLQAGGKGGDVGVLLRHVALKGPHALVQPGDEVHIVADAAADLLGGMDMGVHKAGKDILSVQIHDLGIGSHQCGIHLAHGFDLVVFHEDTAAVIHGLMAFRHGHDITIFQQNLFHNNALLFQSREMTGSMILNSRTSNRP